MSVNYSQFLSLVTTRESCRDYDATKQVTKEDVQKLLDIGALAPSACNSQPWKFVVVQGQKAAQMPPMLKRGVINRWADSVSTFIVICETKAELNKGAADHSQHFAQLDLGIATAHIVLAATASGLSTCILGCFDEQQLKQLLNIPEDVTIRLVLTVGYAKVDKIRKKSRKPITQACSFDSF